VVKIDGQERDAESIEPNATDRLSFDVRNGRSINAISVYLAGGERIK
jgi:hypothetical protein